MEIQHLPATSIGLIADIDRSETVSYAYRIRDGQLERYAVDWDIPTFRATGDGPNSVHSHIETWQPIVESGAFLLGAYVDSSLAGLAIVDPVFESPMAWLAFMHISRSFRRRGAGRALWAEATSIARSHEATSIYVSAIPSGPAMDFYLSRGCVLADNPHPALFEAEPEDIHLICKL